MSTEIAPSRPTSRFVTLDAMRGAAALLVVVYHVGIYGSAPSARFGYLAVDVFFVLSGFVISHAYDAKMATGMSRVSFMGVRWRRLYPIYLLGLILGLVAAVIARPPHAATFGTILTTFSLGLFAIPTWTSGALPVLFPLTHPFWSLFFEFWVANAIFCLFWKQLRGPVLLIFIGLCALGLLWNEKAFYTVNTGWGWPNFWGGFARVGYSFFLGVYLNRLRLHSRAHQGTPSAIIIIALIALLALPISGRLAHWYEVGCVLVAFPLLVYLGAGAVERFPRMGAYLGDVSYSAYAIHWPIIVLALFASGRSLVSSLPQPSLTAALMLETGIVAVVVILSMVASKAYEPFALKLIDRLTGNRLRLRR